MRKKADQDFPPVEDVVRDILDGKIRVQDVDREHPNLFVIQDNVAMLGQDSLYDRSNERLGRSDVGVILLRKIYERELRALAEGKSVKDWRRPREQFVIGFQPDAAA